MLVKYKKTLLSTIACGVLFGVTSLHAENENIVNSIMKLRADVESLYTKIDDNKEAYKAELKSYNMQITDNEAQINRQETALKLLDSELKEAQTKLKELSSKNESIKPMLIQALDNLIQIIQKGIPFKVAERTADVEKIKTQLNSGDITEEKALSLTWAAYGDVIRLTKEIGLFKQEINVDGEVKLAKIAKLGSIMMFFSTPDDKVGYVTKEGDKYNYKVVTNKEDREKIVTLFDSLQKQIRTGYFSLPNALILSESN